MSVRFFAVCVTASAALVACSPSNQDADPDPANAEGAASLNAADTPAEPAYVPRPIKQGVPFTTADGLQIIAHTIGKGTRATNDHPVTVHYTGWLLDETAAEKKGKMFDSSVQRDTPFRFTLGQGQVIRGWDEGVLGMKVGGKRTLIIPPQMAYGSRGAGGVIPPSATLVFDVELLGVE